MGDLAWQIIIFVVSLAVLMLVSGFAGVKAGAELGRKAATSELFERVEAHSQDTYSRGKLPDGTIVVYAIYDAEYQQGITELYEHFGKTFIWEDDLQGPFILPPTPKETKHD